MSAATKNQERLAGIIAEVVMALGIDVGDCNMGPGPDICALGDEAVAALKSRPSSTPSGRAEELITQLEAEIVNRDARIAGHAQDIELLRLNIADYNEHERCYQAELAALKAQSSGVVLPEPFEMRPFQTVDQGSTNYKAGFNAAIRKVRESLNPCRAQSVPSDRIDSGCSFSLDDLDSLIEASDRDTQALRMACLMTGHTDRSGDCYKALGEILYDAGCRFVVAQQKESGDE